MYIIVIGGGRIGESIAKALIAEKDDVVIVELDDKRADELANKLDALIVKGDGSNADILKDAGIEKADALAAMTKDDKVNLMACQIAKQMDVPKITSRVNDPDNEALFIQAGIDAAISASSAIVTNFKNVLRGRGTKTLLTLAEGKLEFMEIHIPENSKLVGKTVGKCGLPDGSKIVSIERGEEVLLPKEDTAIVKKDILGIIAKSEVSRDVLRKLGKAKANK